MNLLHWKQCPYWLKGGVLGLAIVFGVFGIALALFPFGRSLHIPNWLLFLPGIAEDVTEPLWYRLLDSSWPTSLYIHNGLKVSIFFFFVQCFVVGALLGWLYGKFQDRNKFV